MKSCSLIIFDWDGTLVDSISRIVSSLQYASLEGLGKAVSAQQARDVIGLGLVEAISRLHPGQPTHTLVPVIEAYKHHYLHLNQTEAPLFNGVLKMLQELHDRQFILAIATGKSHRGLQHAFEEHPVADFFSAVRCASHYPSKPDPEMLLDILRTFNTPAEQALMIGDSIHDLEMAKNAGVDAIGVTHGVHNETTLMQHQPLYCLNDVTKLCSLVSHNTTDSKG